MVPHRLPAGRRRAVLGRVGGVAETPRPHRVAHLSQGREFRAACGNRREIDCFSEQSESDRNRREPNGFGARPNDQTHQRVRLENRTTRWLNRPAIQRRRGGGVPGVPLLGAVLRCVASGYGPRGDIRLRVWRVCVRVVPNGARPPRNRGSTRMVSGDGDRRPSGRIACRFGLCSVPRCPAQSARPLSRRVRAGQRVVDGGAVERRGGPVPALGQ